VVSPRPPKDSLKREIVVLKPLRRRLVKHSARRQNSRKRLICAVRYFTRTPNSHMELYIRRLRHHFAHKCLNCCIAAYRGDDLRILHGMPCEITNCTTNIHRHECDIINSSYGYCNANAAKQDNGPSLRAQTFRPQDVGRGDKPACRHGGDIRSLHCRSAYIPPQFQEWISG